MAKLDELMDTFDKIVRVRRTVYDAELIAAWLELKAAIQEAMTAAQDDVWRKLEPGMFKLKGGD